MGKHLKTMSGWHYVMTCSFVIVLVLLLPGAVQTNVALGGLMMGMGMVGCKGYEAYKRGKKCHVKG